MIAKQSSDIIVGSLGSCVSSVSFCPQPAMNENYLFLRGLVRRVEQKTKLCLLS